MLTNQYYFGYKRKKQKGLHHVAPFVHQYLMVMRELLFHFSDGFSTFHFHFNTTVW